jgi:periplasmic divalent cation tolerance protein
MGSLQLQFTIDDLERGEGIAAELLHERLVACAQTIGPVTSRYWWNGSVERAREWMFVCKTTNERVDAAIELIRAQHPYEVPEIVATEITAALAPYAEWIAAEVSSEA